MKALDIRMGARALSHVRANGLRPDDVTIVPGAAGGPKGLGLAKLDEWLFAEWLPQSFATRSQPIDLIGASIGAWRFAAVCRGNVGGTFSAAQTSAALAHFAKAYSEQHYPRKVNSAYITAYARDLIDGLFIGHIDEVLTHPHYRLNVLAVRGKGILAREQRGRTHAGYAMAAFANTVGRPHLRHFLDRTWFHATGNQPDKVPVPLAVWGKKASNSSPTLGFDHFKTDYVALTKENFGNALIASGSIPLVLDGVKTIEGAPEGTYWDGGIIDYHLHLPYERSAGITLYPHFTHKIIPGWLDKLVPWRKAKGAWLDNVILVSPSREYLDALPYKKLPDRKDFTRFVDDYEHRLAYWRTAMEESGRLRDALADMIARGTLADAATAL